jgi:hypothetical protein
LNRLGDNLYCLIHWDARLLGEIVPVKSCCHDLMRLRVTNGNADDLAAITRQHQWRQHDLLADFRLHEAQFCPRDWQGLLWLFGQMEPLKALRDIQHDRNTCSLNSIIDSKVLSEEFTLGARGYADD